MSTVALSKTLYCTEGSADKEYRIQMVDVGGGLFNVVGFNGRRGSALKEQPKTKAPVSRKEAMKVFESLEKEKRRKGYTEDASGVPYALAENRGQVSGWLPQLPTPISLDDAERFLRDDSIVAQEKYDGERRGAEFGEDQLRGINKKGLYVPTPITWLPLVASLGQDTLLDAEHVGDVLHVFDALKIGGQDLSGRSFEQRWAALNGALTSQRDPGPVRLVYTAAGYEAKKRFMDTVRERHGEGLVFRRLDGQYKPGEAPSVEAAVVWKLKFQESCTAIVGSVHPTKNSVGLVLLDDSGAEVQVGNVTVPANQQMPDEGDLVEVRYLYKYDGGSLFQPVLLGRRTDQAREDARLSKVTRIKRRGQGDEEVLAA